jgi:hypothetical protein
MHRLFVINTLPLLSTFFPHLPCVSKSYKPTLHVTVFSSKYFWLMKRYLTPLFSLFLLATAAPAQAALYNTISGVVWHDVNSNAIRDSADNRIPGILVTLVLASNDSVVSAALSDDTGAFALKNYYGTGNFYLNYVFPYQGYTVVWRRVGTNDSINSAADSTTTGFVDNWTVSTPPFTVTSNANLHTYGLGLRRIPNTITVWDYKPVTGTSWSETFRLPKSSNGVAVANRVSFLMNEAVFHPTIGFENLDPSPQTVLVEGSGKLTLAMPTGPNVVLQTSVARSVSFGGYDNVTDYGGTSGITWTDASSAAHYGTDIYNNTLLDHYRTTTPPDSVSIYGNAVSAYTISGGSLQATVITNSGAGIFITYTYPGNVPLPITLLSFSGAVEGTGSLLRWEAFSRTDNDYFVVERSRDGLSYSELGKIPAIHHEQGQVSHYRFTDAMPEPGKNFYRLKIVAENGRSEYSPVAVVTFGKGGGVIRAYPNPASNMLTVFGAEDSRIELFNATGQLMPVSISRMDGTAVINVSTIPEGIYSLQITEAGNVAPQVERISIRRH